MRNIFLFIKKFFVFFLFLVLQVISISILITYNKTHQAIFSGIANEMTGWVSSKYNDVEYYFRLKKTNEDLAAENSRLRTILAGTLDEPDTTKLSRIDSLLKDTLGRVRKFNFLPAKVVNNSVNHENNYITLFRGSKQGVNTNMAVCGPDGIVGRIVSVSDNYSIVMSLLNHNSKVSAMILHSNYTGIVEWHGSDPQYLELQGIPKSAKLKIGDTVITSNLSGNFPEGLIIGTVTENSIDQSTGNYHLKLKSATNFFTIQFAYLIENSMWTEQKQLESKSIVNP
ncbi:MAG: rod shape-determining protein MreC [Bacteroidetes bacterium]|nr:rod shape-determining protein MreC [Bacteroidota bacterium]